MSIKVIAPDPEGVNKLSVERAHSGYVVRYRNPETKETKTVVCMNFRELADALGAAFDDNLDNE